MKVLLGLCILISSLLFIDNVNASSFEVDIKGDTEFTDEATLYLEIDNLVDFDGSCKGLCGLVGNLEYDSTKITLKSIEAQNEFNLTKGTTIVLYKNTGVKSGSKILKMVFKNENLKVNDTTSISFKNIVVSDGDNDITGTDITTTIKLVAPKVVTKTDKKTNEVTKETNEISNETPIVENKENAQNSENSENLEKKDSTKKTELKLENEEKKDSKKYIIIGSVSVVVIGGIFYYIKKRKKHIN